MAINEDIAREGESAKPAPEPAPKAAPKAKAKGPAKAKAKASAKDSNPPAGFYVDVGPKKRN